MADDLQNIRPQPGPQWDFLSCSADVAWIGGAAGGGKTFALLLEPLRHVRTVRGFGAVIFRRETPSIRAEGSMWDESTSLYSGWLGAPRETMLDWTFPPLSNRIKFSHMEKLDDRLLWKGSQIPLIEFDQVEEFEREQFFYMFSRNRYRGPDRFRPYIRASYNPVPPDDKVGGWIHEFVGWYLDENGEYPDLEKAGRIRWFVNLNNDLHWFDDRAAALEAFPDIVPTSFAFFPASVYDNAALLEKDPGYLANLFALPPIDQERLLRSNHRIRPSAGKIFRRSWFRLIESPPEAFDAVCRFWDFAASEKKRKLGAATAGVLVGIESGRIYILDVIERWLGPADINELVKSTALRDGRMVRVRWEEEGGSAGKRDSYHLTSMLVGFDALGVRPQGDKLVRSKALARQAKAGNVYVLERDWTAHFLDHMHMIPEGLFDIHDAAAGAFNDLTLIPYSEYHSDMEEPISISPY